MSKVPHWLLELDGRRIRVEVPATSANLGAGYDCIALALELVDQVELEVRSWSRGEVDADGHRRGRGGAAGRPHEPVRARPRGGARRRPRGEEVPPNGRLVGRRWPTRSRWSVASARRPRRRSPASSAATRWSGSVSRPPTCSGWRPRSRAIPTTSRRRCWAASSCRPRWTTATVASRRSGSTCRATCARSSSSPSCASRPGRCAPCCPRRCRCADAVTNLGHVALGVAGLATGRHDLLRLLTRDRLHERYRAAAYPQLPALLAAAVEGGAIGACLSGAGSTIIAFADTVKALTRVEASARRRRRRGRPAGHASRSSRRATPARRC